jgi:hypothetical protein
MVAFEWYIQNATVEWLALHRTQNVPCSKSCPYKRNPSGFNRNFEYLYLLLFGMGAEFRAVCILTRNLLGR